MPKKSVTNKKTKSTKKTTQRKEAPKKQGKKTNKTRSDKRKHEVKRRVTKKTKLQRYKKSIIIITTLLVIILALLGLANFKVKLLFDNEASISITPSISSVSITNGEVAQLNFSTNIERPGICDFTCERKVIDLSTDTTVQTGNINLKEHSETITFPVPIVGAGQNIYNYKVTCTAQAGRLCPVEEKQYKATAFVTVNHELNNKQQAMQQEQETQLNSQLEKMAEMQSLINYLEDKNKELVNTSGENVQTDNIKQLKTSMQTLQEDIQTIIALWETQSFEAIQELLPPTKNQISTLNTTSQAILLELEAIETNYNTAMQLLEQIHRSDWEEAWLLRGEDQEDLFALNASYERLANNKIVLEFILQRAINLYEEYDDLKETLQNAQLRKEQITNEVYSDVQADVAQLINTTINITDCTTLAAANALVANYSQENRSTNLNDLKTVLNVYCDSHDNYTLFVSTPPHITTINKKPVAKQELPTPQAQCCFAGACANCGEQEKTPIILVHGHSFMQSHSPELAFTRLNFLQEALAKEGYVNAGRIGQGFAVESIPRGDWGQNKQPVVVSMTYYYINTFHLGELQILTRKTDSIENYAIRLKESVDLVRQKTGREEVILIAHSMGGLVSREYLRLFGDEEVKALIILGTPNHGVEGDVKRFCTVTGAKAECEDMYADSLFLQRLNNPASNPQHTTVYTVTATGCDMKSDVSKSETGDGVVLARSVQLDFSTNYNVTGTCTDLLQTDLHMNFVNPNLYPKTYEIIKEILEEIENE